MRNSQRKVGGREGGRKRERQADTQTTYDYNLFLFHRQTDSETDRQRSTRVFHTTVEQTNRETDSQSTRQTDRQTNRQ